MAIYKLPMSSTTSFSDDDNEDDTQKAIFYAGPHRLPLTVAPAIWASKMRPKHSSSVNGSPISQLPAEVLIHILKHLQSVRDLYSALRVSRTWCECSVELLWHKPTFPRYETLQKMARALLSPKQTFTYSRFIRRLNLLSLSGNIKDDILSAFTSCDRLERLTLVNCEQITDKTLNRVFPRFPDLVAVDLSGVVPTTDQAIITLATTAKGLQGINLSGCSNVSDAGIMALAQNCPLLRRVKLSGLTALTDAPISALAQSCPLILELDLNFCGLVTDISLRDIWVHSSYMRELRVSHCSQLTDAAFPAPQRPDGWSQLDVTRPFPSHAVERPTELPLLVLNRPLEHLRMLDLTACSLITDDAIEGIISQAPKIRSLVLSKCGLLTDRSIENICRLGRHLHYLHLGHVVKITDSSVRTLARSCTRLRYVDFANCLLLTDMSVFELSALPKLRRIGLVRVSNLTDEAIYALGDRHTTLERIHLSYCDQITVMAIHFLLQKLHKLTHLSLTGIPAFRQPELQRFCRDPPKGFNSTQQLAFCVYSGKGVAELRGFLTALFDHITEMNSTDDTEYEDDDNDDDPYNIEDTPEPYEEEEEEEEGHNRPPRLVTYTATTNTYQEPSNPPPSHEFVFRRDRPIRSAIIPPSGRSTTSQPSTSAYIEGATHRLNAQILADSMVAGSSRRQSGQGHRQHSMADILPIIEASNSPPPSDVASSHSARTSHSNGAGFFRTYQDGVPLEIGHGRGTNGPQIPATTLNSPRSGFPSTSRQRHTHVETDQGTFSPAAPLSRPTAMTSSTSFQNTGRSQARPQAVAWPYREPDDTPNSTTGDLLQQVPPDERGRSMKRSFRNTFNIAEHYANFFGRSRSRAGGSSPLQGSADNNATHWR